MKIFLFIQNYSYYSIHRLTHSLVPHLNQTMQISINLLLEAQPVSKEPKQANQFHQSGNQPELRKRMMSS